jgi:hypothetical protein
MCGSCVWFASPTSSCMVGVRAHHSLVCCVSPAVVCSADWCLYTGYGAKGDCEACSAAKAPDAMDNTDLVDEVRDHHVLRYLGSVHTYTHTCVHHATGTCVCVGTTSTLSLWLNACQPTFDYCSRLRANTHSLTHSHKHSHILTHSHTQSALRTHTHTHPLTHSLTLTHSRSLTHSLVSTTIFRKPEISTLVYYPSKTTSWYRVQCTRTLQPCTRCLVVDSNAK